MLYDDNGVAYVAESLERVEQALVVDAPLSLQLESRSVRQFLRTT